MAREIKNSDRENASIHLLTQPFPQFDAREIALATTAELESAFDAARCSSATSGNWQERTGRPLDSERPVPSISSPRHWSHTTVRWHPAGTFIFLRLRPFHSAKPRCAWTT